MLEGVPEFKGFDPTYVVSANSAHANNNESRSTACDTHVFQGGLIDHISWVPNLIPQLTAESKSDCHLAAIMRVLHAKKAISHLLHGEKDVDLTVPICVNNLAAVIMNTSDAPTHCTRHMESRCWFGKQAIQQGHAKFVKVDGALQQPANDGTKNFQA